MSSSVQAKGSILVQFAMQVFGLPPQAPRSRAARAASAVLATMLAALSACSPAYDWRESRTDDAHWLVLLPGRPATATRDIRLGDMPVKMTMQGARVGDTAFTVAEAELPDDSADTRARAVAAMREALVRNIAGHETAAAAATITRVDASGRSIGTVAALAIEATGQVRGAPATLMARLAARDRLAVQALVVGPDLDREQAATFFDSLRLRD